MFKPKRLHPVVIAVHTIKNIKELLFPLMAIFLFSHNWAVGTGLSILLLTGALLVLIFVNVLSWYRYTYELNDKELRIEYGILTRKKRYIPYERIQSLDVTEGVLQRIFGLVKIQIETAGGDPLGGAEAVFSAISKQESESIQSLFTKAKKGQLTREASESRDETVIIYKISIIQLLLLSLTSGGVGVAISAIYAFISQFDDLIPYKRLYGNMERFMANNIMIGAVIVFISLLLIWLFALIGMMLKYAHFTVQKTEDDLIISQGLLARRQITVPLKRIQAVRINENVIRQLLGYASVSIESAGGSSKNKEGSRVMLLPLVKLNQVAPIINRTLIEYHFTQSFGKAPKAALIRYMIRSWFISVPIVAAAVIFFNVWGLLFLILFAGLTCWAYLMYKDAGWNLDNQQLTFRYRVMNRHTIFMKKNKIQCLQVRDSYFQRKKGLATIQAFLKSGMGSTGGKVTDLSVGDIGNIFSWYTAKKGE